MFVTPLESNKIVPFHSHISVLLFHIYASSKPSHTYANDFVAASKTALRKLLKYISNIAIRASCGDVDCSIQLARRTLREPRTCIRRNAARSVLKIKTSEPFHNLPDRDHTTVQVVQITCCAIAYAIRNIHILFLICKLIILFQSNYF